MRNSHVADVTRLDLTFEGILPSAQYPSLIEGEAVGFVDAFTDC